MIQNFSEFKIIKEAQQDFYNDFINILLLEKENADSYYTITLTDEFNDWLAKNKTKLINNRNQFIESIKKYMNKLIEDSIITTENYKQEITLSDKQKVNSVRPENNKMHERLVASNLDQFEDKGKFPDNLKDLDLANEKTGRGAVIKVFRYTLSKLYLGDSKILDHNQLKSISLLDNDKMNSASAGNMKAISQIFTNE